MTETIIVRLVICHLVADWLLQNEWMAVNKSNLSHPAGWVHGGIHALAVLMVVPWYVALVIGISHILIDTRIPTVAWGKLFKQTSEGPFALPVALWRDQIFHLVIIVIVALARK